MAVEASSGLFLIQPAEGIDLHDRYASFENDVWKDTLTIPFHCAIVSFLAFALHIFFAGRHVKSLWRHWSSRPEPAHSALHPTSSISSEIKERAKMHGGPVILVWKVSRLLGCVLLLALSIYTTILAEESDDFGLNSRDTTRDSKSISPRKLQHLGLCLASMHTIFLALVTVSSERPWGVVASRHLDLMLLVFLGVYAYRDVLPFATFDPSPADEEEGWALWAKMCVLSLIALVFPLCVPRQYIPVDPEAPLEHPCPEQTASLLSLATYTFLNPVIILGNRLTHLPSNLLPPLADYDSAVNLRKRAFPVLENFVDPTKRHIFFGLLLVFKAEYIILSLMIIIQVLAGFASPFGIKQILEYIETDGANATIKPWFWITWLFLGPTINSISYQWYMYVATRVLVRVECILTELVFEHTLKLRLKAGESGKNEGDATDSSSIIGRINNLVTTDLANIADGRDFLYLILFVPLQIALCIIFLYSILEWSAFVGLAVMLAFFPLPGYIAKCTQGTQVKCMETTDMRIATVSETMSVLRMVKMFGWETKMYEGVVDKRDQELVYVRMRQVLDFANGVLNWTIPVGTMVASYFTLLGPLTVAGSTMVMKQPLSASILFSSITVFDMLKDQLHIVFFVLNQVIAGKVSLDRMDNFVKAADLLDEFTSNKGRPSSPKDIVGFRNASFSWAGHSPEEEIPSKPPFVIKVEGNLIFAPKKINLIIGPTGSGKTSLLMALLGEMHYAPLSPDSESWFSLPRSTGVAYAAQESWIQNETIRENILFGCAFDKERYEKVLHQCGLVADLALFEAGDQTEVGEKGLTLSGGQKARITLARAIYSPAEILLLDDVFAALDTYTSKWIVDECFSGALIKDRTVILVTHNVALARPIAGYVVSMGSDGRILSHGSMLDAVELDASLVVEIEEKDDGQEGADEHADVHKDVHKDVNESLDGKLILAEEVEEGHVSWSAVKLYFSGMGGRHPALFFLLCVSCLALCEAGLAFQTWFLGYWASQYLNHSPDEVPVLHYVGTYVLCCAASLLVYALSYAVYIQGAMRASRTLHNNLVQSILGTTMRWLDTTPISRILARCTQDIRAIDGPISVGLFYFGGYTLTMLARFCSVIFFTPIFMVPGLLVAVFGGLFAQLYIKAQLSVKREMSAAKAPVLGHLGAAISGVVSLRAYGAQEAFIRESMKRIDRYTRAASTFHNLNRWVCVRVDALGGLFAAGLATYLLYFKTHGASNTGFSLNMAVGFSGMILWWIQRLNELEVQGNSLERVERYTNIEQEPKPTGRGTPPAYWPSSGKLEVNHLSARYTPDGPDVLHGISFTVAAGERIGIVGRTGSGKSSLTMALLRCICTEGEVLYDGLNTSELNLDCLRSNITIIPQVPELLSGTLRQNLDPFSQYDDAALNSALRASGLFSLYKDSEGERNLTLESQISMGGSNLSVGQRQILALARAIVRGSKLLILDEATSAIDHETDAVIQSSLRHELGPGVTVITVAHRLHTIMDADKIMVLDAGNIVEFDKPSELLKDPRGKLRALVDKSGDKERLFGMAGFRQVEN